MDRENATIESLYCYVHYTYKRANRIWTRFSAAVINTRLSIPSLYQCLTIFTDAYKTTLSPMDNLNPYCTIYRRFKSYGVKGPTCLSFAIPGHNSTHGIRKFTANKRRYKQCLYQKAQIIPKCSFVQFVYVDQPAFVTLTSDIKTDRYKQIILQAYGLDRTQQSTGYTLMIDKNDIPNSLSIDQATAMAKRADTSPGLIVLKPVKETNTTLVLQQALPTQFVVTRHPTKGKLYPITKTVLVSPTGNANRPADNRIQLITRKIVLPPTQNHDTF